MSEFEFDIGDALVERAPQPSVPDRRQVGALAGELDALVDQPVALCLLFGESLPVIGVNLLELFEVAGMAFRVEGAQLSPFGAQGTELVVGQRAALGPSPIGLAGLVEFGRTSMAGSSRRVGRRRR